MDLTTVDTFRPARTRADLTLASGETLLAGGSWVMSVPQPTVSGLVDLTTMGWPEWETTATGLSIGATCTIARLQQAPLSVDLTRLVKDAADSLAMSFKIQHVATVGGNVCLALPAGAMISLLAALDAVALVWTPDGSTRREVVADLVRDTEVTSLAPGEVLRSLEVPHHALAARTSLRRESLNTIGRSASVVIGRVDPDGRATVTITAATSRPVLLRFAALPAWDELEAAVTAIPASDWYDDPHGSPDWRAAVTVALAREVLADLTGALAGGTGDDR